MHEKRELKEVKKKLKEVEDDSTYCEEKMQLYRDKLSDLNSEK